MRKRVGLSPDTFLIIEPLIFLRRGAEVEEGEDDDEGEEGKKCWGGGGGRERLTD